MSAIAKGVTLSRNSSAELLSPASIHSLLSQPDDKSVSNATSSSSVDSSQTTPSQSPVNPVRARPTKRRLTGTKRIFFPTVLNSNLRGAFCQKMDEIQVTFDQCDIDIAFLTETWLHSGISSDLIDIPNYTCYLIVKIVLMVDLEVGSSYMCGRTCQLYRCQ